MTITPVAFRVWSASRLGLKLPLVRSLSGGGHQRLNLDRGHRRGDGGRIDVAWQQGGEKLKLVSAARPGVRS